MPGSGSEVEVVWNGRRVRAWVPALLHDRDLALDAPTVAKTAAAATEVGYAAEALSHDYEALARLLLRSEGVASSYIEGIAAPAVDVVLAEEQLGRPHAGAAAWVASNLAAVGAVVAGRGTSGPLSLDVLCAWHRTLMAGSPTPARHVGVVRREQGWIGGSSPLDAHLVTPPPAALAALLDDLMAYVNRSDVDPVAQAAVAHAQFEIIHPFGDGNGRVGRMLVGWLLLRRLSLLVPPPVSVAIAADVGGYTSGLVRFRLGEHRPWVRWFADAVASGGRAQRALVASVEDYKKQWRERLGAKERKTRNDAAVFAALELLPRHVVFTSATLVEELGISRKAALATLRRLADVGIVTAQGRVRGATAGQPSALFVAQELLGLAGSTPLR